MIVKGNQRSGGSQLATHLLKDENEHVTVHEIRGFMSDDLHGAFAETHAIAKGTNCKQYLFSMSLNPPNRGDVATDAFMDAANEAEQRLGLNGQPRAIVFHEKEGRRHAHVVWSRIDAETMTAINLPFTKNKLTQLSRDLYLQHGWEMPQGLRDPLLRDPTNFTQAEWQQALRTDRDLREIKQAIQEAWQQSDDRRSFRAALVDKGFALSKGDRRGYVVVDYTGEVYALTRAAAITAKEARQRIGERDTLPGVEQAKEIFRERIKPKMNDLIDDQRQQHRDERKPLVHEIRQLAKDQQRERAALNAKQAERWAEEASAREARLHRGLKGVWQWVSGEAAEVRAENERQAWSALKRDQAERDQMVFRHLDARQDLRQRMLELRERQQAERAEMAARVATALKLERRREAIRREMEAEQEHRRRDRGRGMGR